MPILSVLMPCYNATTTLGDALESLIIQTLTDFEIVCVDDGSDDGTGEMLETWAGRELRVKVLHQPHNGIIQTLNAGLNLCGSPYVARMDADDRSRPERLQRQVDFLEFSPADRCCGLPGGWISGRARSSWFPGLHGLAEHAVS